MKRRIFQALLLVLPALVAMPVWPQGASEAPPPPQSARKPLDLHLRNAKELLSESEWERLAAGQPPVEEEWRPPEEQAQATAEVKARRPQVPDGIGALFWAFRNPTQAWRIFLPAASAEETRE